MKGHTLGAASVVVLMTLVLKACGGEAPPPEASEEATQLPASVAAVVNAPPQYRGVPDWTNLPPEIEFGDMSGVDVDSHGHVIVVHRGDRGFSGEVEGRIPEPVVVTLDPESGEVVQAWGAETFGVPHGLTVDHEDNVWITDVALHQVFKFTHDGELLLTIGEAGVPGWDEGHFDQPTQVAILPDGSFYVGDGYGNSRVAKFAADGTYQFEWGEPGDGQGQFDNPHGVTIGQGGNVIVSDRENARLQIFTQDGTFIREWLGAQQVGRIFSTEVGSDGFMYLAIRPGGRDVLRTGVMKLDPEYNLVATIGFKATGDAVFNSAHYVGLGLDGAVYLAETPDQRVSKYVPIQ